MTLNLQQRFLMLFADYREAIAQVASAEDEARFYRSLAGDLQIRLDANQVDMVHREREIADRMMRMRHGERATATPEQLADAIRTGAARKANQAPSDNSFVHKTTQETWQAIQNLERAS